MEMQTLEKIIEQHPFFGDLESPYTSLLVGCASNVRFDAGKYVLCEGEEANAFYLIRQGEVAIEISPPQGKRIIVDTIGEGEILGWSWLFPPYIWKFHARCLTGVRAIALDAKCLRTKCEQNHDLGYELLKRFSQVMNRRLDATRMQLLDVYAAR